MTHQPSFSQAEFATKKKTTPVTSSSRAWKPPFPGRNCSPSSNRFIRKVNAVAPPVGLERMLRVYFLQQWAWPTKALKDALYDSQALQGFAHIDLSAEGVPDATTLLTFRRLLETHDLCQGLFSAINADLAVRGLLLREGTLVDATLMAAPSSTKNQAKQRDSEMH